MRSTNDTDLLNMVMLFDLTFMSMHKSAQAVMESNSKEERSQYMKDLIEIKKVTDKYIKREVIQ